MREALPIIAALGLPLLVHAELPERLREPDPRCDPREYESWLDSRPPESELAAIELLIRLARETGATIIVHLASADALPARRRARRRGRDCRNVSSLSDVRGRDIAAGATAFKCAPPIRGRDHRERLWNALAARQIDLVATDHSPAPAALKRLEDGNFAAAWGGIASLQIGFSATWTGAAARGIPLEQVVQWMATRPARLARLDATKGAIAVGRDADLVFWDPDAEITVDPAALHHRHPITPYAGMRLRGRVHKTMLRGEVVFDGERVSEPAAGRQLLGQLRC